MSVLRCAEKRHAALIMVLYLINAKGYTSNASSAIREELIIIKQGKSYHCLKKGDFPSLRFFLHKFLLGGGYNDRV